MLRLFTCRGLLVTLTGMLVLSFAAYVTHSYTAAPRMQSRPVDLWPGTGAWAKQQLEAMTLEQKIAQMFSARAYGHFKGADNPSYQRLVDLVERFQIGGITFFQSDPLAQAALANDLQQRSRVPLLISQDMEWGAGMRIEHTTSFPRAMAIGATRNPAFARNVGYVTALEARALGTHQVYAPVADVNNNPGNPIINVRSFGQDPQMVAEMVTAFADGMQQAGVIATAKHFPGHGDTAIDSHADLPILPFGRARLNRVELIPFQAAIEHGIMSVMVGHLALPELEPDSTVPASLSSAVTQKLLREEMGFSGLIVTDGLDMRGVTKHFGPGEAAVRAVEAGADVILLSEDAYAARAAILRAIEVGRLSESRIDDSVLRILRAKEWLDLPQEQLVDLSVARLRVATQSHEALSTVIAHQSLTLLRNENDLLPLIEAPNRILSVTLSDDKNPDRGRLFDQHLQRLAPGAQVTTRLIDERSGRADYAEALYQARTADLIIVPAYLQVRAWSGRIGLSPDHQTFINKLVDTGTPVVLLSFGNPYMIAGLHPPEAYIAAYSDEPAVQEATARALFGQSGFQGRLPVTIPDQYAYSAGLQTEQVKLRPGYPASVGMNAAELRRIDSLMWAEIDKKAFPGAVVAVGRGGVLVKSDGYGYYTYNARHPVTSQSVFDLASLTKVVATTTAAMLLYEQGKLDLDARVAKYLSDFGKNGKDEVTIRQLLTHSSGLTPFRPFHQMGFKTRDEVIAAVMKEKLEFAPGTQTQYSDLGMITLMLVIEKITGQSFAAYTKEHIFEPLGMTRTGFHKTGAMDTSVVPTEIDTAFRKRLIQGEVHDETAWLLGGTSGHAGLFSTAEDLATFAYMLLHEGRIHGKWFLKPETIRLFSQATDGSTRALGWDTKSPEGYSSAGHFFGPKSFGHTGFTGTSLWIDPEAKLFAILLTNRVYPTRENRAITQVRPKFADLAYRAIEGPPELLPLETKQQRTMVGSR